MVNVEGSGLAGRSDEGFYSLEVDGQPVIRLVDQEPTEDVSIP